MSKPKSKYAVLRDGSLVRCEILTERKFLWRHRYLVAYTENIWEGGRLLYTNTNTQWVKVVVDTP